MKDTTKTNGAAPGGRYSMAPPGGLSDLKEAARAARTLVGELTEANLVLAARICGRAIRKANDRLYVFASLAAFEKDCHQSRSTVSAGLGALERIGFLGPRMSRAEAAAIGIEAGRRTVREVRIPIGMRIPIDNRLLARGDLSHGEKFFAMVQALNPDASVDRLMLILGTKDRHQIMQYRAHLLAMNIMVRGPLTWRSAGMNDTAVYHLLPAGEWVRDTSYPRESRKGSVGLIYPSPDGLIHPSRIGTTISEPLGVDKRRLEEIRSDKNNALSLRGVRGEESRTARRVFCIKDFARLKLRASTTGSMPWHKVYKDIWIDYEFYQLPLESKLLYFWCLAMADEADGTLSIDPGRAARVARVIGVETVDFESLVNAGYLIVVGEPMAASPALTDWVAEGAASPGLATWVVSPKSADSTKWAE